MWEGTDKGDRAANVTSWLLADIDVVYWADGGKKCDMINIKKPGSGSIFIYVMLFQKRLPNSLA